MGSPRTVYGGLCWLCLAVVWCTGCDLDVGLQDLSLDKDKRSAKSSLPPSASPKQPIKVDRTSGTVAVASFNIQVFGTSKLAKPRVMDVLAQIVRKFDVVAIQEIRSKSQHVIPEFVQRVNAGGANYDYIVGPRLGRTVSKEQYAFIYDLDRLEVVRQSRYTVNDAHDLFHREPLVSTFRVRGNHARTPFSFTLVNIHTDPDEAELELDALAGIFQGVQQDRIREDDVILLGDFNADAYHMGRLGRLPGMTAAIRDIPTNTRRTESYDNLLFDRRTTVEYTGRSGTIDFQQAFGLTESEALEVSDHLPVWASFRIEEGVAGQPITERSPRFSRQ